MELALNLVWAMLAAILAGMWLRFGTARGGQRRMQLVALAVLVLTLFPVISVSDDLLTLQSPAEVDSSLRRDHVAPGAHSVIPAVAALPLPVMAEISFPFLSVAAPGSLAIPVQTHPGLAAVQDRPPPAA